MVTSEVGKAREASTFESSTSESFFLILVFSLFLLTFLGLVIATRNNRRLLRNGNIEAEQPDEEQQMLIRNATAADQRVVCQQNRFEIEASHDQGHHRRQCNFGISLAFVNCSLEIPSAVLDQLASEKKPIYILIMMLFSFTSMLLCLVELVYNGRRKKIAWRWSSGRIPWFYHPPPSNTPFGTFAEIIGLICAMAQCIATTINYVFCIQEHYAPIKIPVMPTIFAFGVLFSKLTGKPDEEDGESRTTPDQNGGNVTLNYPILDGESRTTSDQGGGDVAFSP